MFNVLAIFLFAARFRADAIEHGTAKAGWLVAIIILVTVNLLFWRRIAIGAGNFARWLYIAFVLLSLFQLPKILGLTARYGPIYGLLMAASFGFGLMSIIVLLRKDSSQWLRSKGRTGEIDASVFD